MRMNRIARPTEFRGGRFGPRRDERTYRLRRLRCSARPCFRRGLSVRMVPNPRRRRGCGSGAPRIERRRLHLRSCGLDCGDKLYARTCAGFARQRRRYKVRRRRARLGPGLVARLLRAQDEVGPHHEDVGGLRGDPAHQLIHLLLRLLSEALDQCPSTPRQSIRSPPSR